MVTTRRLVSGSKALAAQQAGGAVEQVPQRPEECLRPRGEHTAWTPGG